MYYVKVYKSIYKFPTELDFEDIQNYVNRKDTGLLTAKILNFYKMMVILYSIEMNDLNIY